MNANIKDSPRHRHLQSLPLSLHTHTQLEKQVKFHIHGNKKEFVVNLSLPSALKLHFPRAVF